MPVICKKCGFMNSDVSIYCDECKAYLLTTLHAKRLEDGIRLNNRYEILSIINSGGMSTVYKAIDHNCNKRICAVKEMTGEHIEPDEKNYMIKRFKREGRILSSLKNPHLPQVIDYFIENNSYYLIMDYIDGRNLEAIMGDYRSRKVPEGLVIEWSIQILNALDYLHSQTPPVIYRDLKPGNIMIRKRDHKIFLIDFGIAKNISPDQDKTNTRIGTSVYAPLEVLQGKPEPRSDLYSLGATMHCLLTSIVPSIPMNFKPVKKINPLVSKKMENIVMKALSRNTDDRFETSKVMKEQLIKLSAENKKPNLKDRFINWLRNKKEKK